MNDLWQACEYFFPEFYIFVYILPKVTTWEKFPFCLWSKQEPPMLHYKQSTIWSWYLINDKKKSKMKCKFCSNTSTMYTCWCPKIAKVNLPFLTAVDLMQVSSPGRTHLMVHCWQKCGACEIYWKAQGNYGCKWNTQFQLTIESMLRQQLTQSLELPHED